MSKNHNPVNNNQGHGKVSQPRQQYNDMQKNYDNSNERNRDNIRDNTRDRQYKEHDKTLTNDENYDGDTQQIKVDAEFDDKNQNVDKNNHGSK